MFWVSLFTTPFGLNEPLFISEYWNPHSLFNLNAITIGFDIESLIFSFATGGIAAIIFEIFINIRYKKLTKKEACNKNLKIISLLSPALVFTPLILLTNLNPIYTTIAALTTGAIAIMLCRHDLIKKMLASGSMFLLFYFIFFLIFNLLYPNLVQEVWNLSAISGILLLGIPLEELIFAFTFGTMWSGLYEHILNLKW